MCALAYWGIGPGQLCPQFPRILSRQAIRSLRSGTGRAKSFRPAACPARAKERVVRRPDFARTWPGELPRAPQVSTVDYRFTKRTKNKTVEANVTMAKSRRFWNAVSSRVTAPASKAEPASIARPCHRAPLSCINSTQNPNPPSATPTRRHIKRLTGPGPTTLSTIPRSLALEQHPFNLRPRSAHPETASLDRRSPGQQRPHRRLGQESANLAHLPASLHSERRAIRSTRCDP